LGPPQKTINKGGIEMVEAVTKLPIKTEGQEPSPGEWRPLANLRREIDRLFDDFGWGV
jgi:hypothetical protein